MRERMRQPWMGYASGVCAVVNPSAVVVDPAMGAAAHVRPLAHATTEGVMRRGRP
jgi:hypothetical protein